MKQLNVDRSINAVRGCYGCAACVPTCRHHAITIHESSEGFYRPKVDLKICVGCGRCREICPSITLPEITARNIRILAARSSRREILEVSSSGGIIPELMDVLSSDGYKTIAARYNPESERVEHIVARTAADIASTGGSKYMPSYTENAWQKMLDNPGRYIVVGTPCQIAGIRRAIGGILRDVIYVEFWCHGVPSLKLWRSFLRMLGLKGAHACARWRDKARFAWANGYCVVLSVDGRVRYAKSGSNGDLYSRHFLRSSCTNMTCKVCPFDLQHSSADIRVGDCWETQVERHAQGLSKIALLTDRGKQVWAELGSRVEEVCLTGEERQAIESVPCGNLNARSGVERSVFIKLLGFPIGFRLAHMWHLAWCGMRRMRSAL